MSRINKWLGGGKTGYFIISFPFVELKVEKDTLIIKFKMFCTYIFKPNQIYALKKESNNIKILHNIKDYPEEITFWYFGNVNKILTKIADLEFVPSLDISKYHVRGFPFRIQILIILFIIWCFSIFCDIVLKIKPILTIGGFTSIMIILYLILSILIFRSKKLQNILLLPDRTIGEIKPTLLLIRFGLCFILLIGIIPYIIKLLFN